MKRSNKIKEFLADVLIKAAQIVFAVLVVGQFVSGRFDLTVFKVGAIIAIISVITSVILMFTLKEE